MPGAERRVNRDEMGWRGAGCDDIGCCGVARRRAPQSMQIYTNDSSDMAGCEGAAGWWRALTPRPARMMRREWARSAFGEGSAAIAGSGPRSPRSPVESGRAGDAKFVMRPAMESNLQRHSESGVAANSRRRARLPPRPPRPNASRRVLEG